MIYYVRKTFVHQSGYAKAGHNTINDMEKSLKVTPKKNLKGGHHLARSFDQLFNLASLRGMGDNFTEAYFRTRSGNIYKLFREKDEFGRPGKWVLVNKASRAEYYPTDAEMYYSHLKIGEPFYYGNGNHTTDVVEIVCVNAGRHYLDIAELPEALLVQQFISNLKGSLLEKVNKGRA
jgi:hypothetical protein